MIQNRSQISRRHFNFQLTKCSRAIQYESFCLERVAVCASLDQFASWRYETLSETRDRPFPTVLSRLPELSFPRFLLFIHLADLNQLGPVSLERVDEKVCGRKVAVKNSVAAFSLNSRSFQAATIPFVICCFHYPISYGFLVEDNRMVQRAEIDRARRLFFHGNYRANVVGSLVDSNESERHGDTRSCRCKLKSTGGRIERKMSTRFPTIGINRHANYPEIPIYPARLHASKQKTSRGYVGHTRLKELDVHTSRYADVGVEKQAAKCPTHGNREKCWPVSLLFPKFTLDNDQSPSEILICSFATRFTRSLFFFISSEQSRFLSTVERTANMVKHFHASNSWSFNRSNFVSRCFTWKVGE